MKRDLNLICACCIEEGHCWLWQHGTNNKGRPIAKLGRPAAELVARVVVELTRGHPLKATERVARTCGQDRCVSPTCAEVVTPSEVVRRAHASGRLSSPQRIRALAEAARRRGITKLTPERAREARSLRSSGLSAAEVGARYGVGRDAIWKLWRGITHKADLPGSMPGASAWSFRP